MFYEQLVANKNDFDKTYNIKNIVLRALQPLDIVVTKVGRYNDRDIQDIKDCITQFKIDKDSIIGRGKEVLKSYPGNDNVYDYKLRKCISDNFEQL